MAVIGDRNDGRQVYHQKAAMPRTVVEGICPMSNRYL